MASLQFNPTVPTKHRSRYDPLPMRASLPTSATSPDTFFAPQPAAQQPQGPHLRSLSSDFSRLHTLGSPHSIPLPLSMSSTPQNSPSLASLSPLHLSVPLPLSPLVSSATSPFLLNTDFSMMDIDDSDFASPSPFSALGSSATPECSPALPRALLCGSCRQRITSSEPQLAPAPKKYLSKKEHLEAVLESIDKHFGSFGDFLEAFSENIPSVSASKFSEKH